MEKKIMKRRKIKSKCNRVKVIIKRKTSKMTRIAFYSQLIYTVNYSTEKRKSQLTRNRKYMME